MFVFLALGNAKVLSFALGEAKVLSLAFGDAKVPNANEFASQWNVGFIVLKNEFSLIVF